ncbi:MAG: Flp pilus assembly protein CpaB [Negativicutes bacterium]|nr:Flp pilus assembly protein CpaB [Negativicutes bacterium]
MAKLSSKGLLMIALVLSLGTSMLVYSYLKGVETQATKQGAPVVVAKGDIPPKTKITAEMVQETSVPPEYIQPGAATTVGEVIGTTSREQIVAGEQVTQRRLMVEGQSRGFSGSIPADKRAVTVAVNEVTGVAGFIKVGDYVDVLVTFDTNTVGENVSQVVLQNLMVLAVDRDAEAVKPEANKDKKESGKTTVTLAVTPEEAARLTVADEKGKIRMALRPFSQGNLTAAASGVTPKDLVGAFAAPVKSGGGGATDNKPSEPPAKSAPHIGIQVIRGTKVDVVQVN